MSRNVDRSPHSPFGHRRAPRLSTVKALPYHELKDEISSETAVGGEAAERLGSCLETAASSRSWLSEIMGGLLASIVIVVLNATYAGVVMNTPVLRPYLTYSIAMCLGCTALSNLWLLVSRRNMPFICVADSFMAVLFATTASNIVRLAPDGSAVFGTLVIAMLLCSLLLSLSYIATGVLRVCNVIQFVPSPVMAGYQASIGYLLFDSAAKFQGCSLFAPQCFMRVGVDTQIALSLGLGVLLSLAQHFLPDGIARILALPTILVLATIVFQVARQLEPWHGSDLALWTMQPPPAATCEPTTPAHWVLPWAMHPNAEAACDLTTRTLGTLLADLDVTHISWSLAAKEALLAAVTAFVPNLLGKLLQYSALEALFDTDIDFNREIRHAGFSQLASAPAIMVPTVTYTGMLVAWDMGARSFVPPAMVVISSIVLLLTGSRVVAVVPNFMFAALLVSIGITMIWDNLRSAWNMLPVHEFGLVILHIILTALLGMLWAVVLGVLFTATIFIVEYSAHSGVLLSATLLLERSKVQRSSFETEILEQYGATVLIVHLHGMIFFGSASSVLEEIKAHVLQLAELQLPLQVLLLDFDRCTGIDSSAVAVLFHTRRQIKDARLIFACAGSSVLSMLVKGAPREFKHFTTLDLALEQCENRLLARYMGRCSDEHDDLEVIAGDAEGTGAELGVSSGGHAGSNPSSDDEYPLDPPGHPHALCALSKGHVRSDNVHERRQKRLSRDRLPNVMGSTVVVVGEHEGQPVQYRCLRPVSGAASGADTAPSSSLGDVAGADGGEARDKAGVAGGAASAYSVGACVPGSVPGSTPGSTPGTPPRKGMPHVVERGALHPSESPYGHCSSSPTDSGLAVIYSPEQARAELRPEALAKMRERFSDAVRSAYGSKFDLDELFDYFDIMLVPPHFTVVSPHLTDVTSGLSPTPPPDGSLPPHLYIIDRGYVSAFYTTLGGEQPSIQRPGGSRAGDLPTVDGAGGSSKPHRRLAKYGPGAILGVDSFVTPDDMPSLTVMPTAAISDEYSQLLRLPRSRCDELERLAPALIFRLYRLLVLISERRLQEHRLRVVASETFKINVRPSTNFQRMLISDQLPTSPRAPPGSLPTSSSTDQLPTCRPRAACAPAASAPASECGV